jgi:hypothetical protein
LALLLSGLVLGVAVRTGKPALSASKEERLLALWRSEVSSARTCEAGLLHAVHSLPGE